MSYFLKYKTIDISKRKYPKSKNIKNNDRNIPINKIRVYDRLFNDSIAKEEMLNNLLNKYLINEEEKYTFSPKINENKNYNGNKYNFVYGITDKGNLLTDRKFSPGIVYNRNYSTDNYEKNNFSTNFNQYIQNIRLKKGIGLNSTSSFTCNNNFYSDINNNHNITGFINNQKNFANKTTNKRIRRCSIPITTKYKNKLYNSFFNSKENEIYEDTYNSTNNKILNKTASSFFPKCSNGILTNKQRNSIIYDYTSNTDFYNYFKNNNNSKNKRKNKVLNNNKIKKYRNPQSNLIPHHNDKTKNLVYISDISLNEESARVNNKNLSAKGKAIKNNYLNNRNYSNSLFNISSICGSIKKENKKIKSPDKNEHLLSFGSEFFHFGCNWN